MKSVTLLVTPQQAEQLDLGQNKGILRLTLRNPMDDEVTPVEEVTIANLSTTARKSPETLPEAAPEIGGEPRTQVRPLMVLTMRGHETAHSVVMGRRSVRSPQGTMLSRVGR